MTSSVLLISSMLASAPTCTRTPAPYGDYKCLCDVISICESGRHKTCPYEVLSPSNKEVHSEGRTLYLRKQREILRSEVNSVEIDLLRGGEHTLAVPHKLLQANAPNGWHDLVSVNCWFERLSTLAFTNSCLGPSPPARGEDQG